MFTIVLSLALAFQAQSPQPVLPAAKQTLDCGHWQPSFMHNLAGFPRILPRFNAAHMALIPKGPNRGKVLVWDIFADQAQSQWKQRWSIVDPVAPGGPAYQNFVFPMPADEGDLFCAGLAWTSEGDLLVVGGTSHYPGLYAGSVGAPRTWKPNSGPASPTPCTSGSPTCGGCGGSCGCGCEGLNSGGFIGGRLTYLWDPTDPVGGNDAWHRQPNMAITRWYPTAVKLGDGSILVAGGTTDTADGVLDANNYEVFAPTGSNPPTGTWQSGSSGRIFAGPGNYLSTFYIYPRLYPLTSGEVFLAGMTSHHALLDHQNAPGVWTYTERSSFDERIYDTTVLMPYVPDALGHYQDEVLIVGGNALNFAKYRRADGVFRMVPQGTQATVDVGHPTAAVPSWDAAAPMHHARKYANGVLLPDGSLFVVGGNNGPGVVVGAVRNPEIFDGSSWTEEAPQDADRTYHSTAVLLPDGRVLSAGGNTAIRDYQVFVPGYLCGGDPRPVLTFAPADMGYYDEAPLVHTFQCAPMPAGQSVERAVLITPGSVTHHTDYNQRFVQLIVESRAADHLDVRAPANRNLVPPGYYMLFLVSAAGVPSEAAWVKVQ